MQKIEIIATLGPATDTIDMIEGLLEAGATIARLNFAWIPDEQTAHQKIFFIREASLKNGKPLHIMADLPGRRVQEDGSHTFDPNAPILTEHDEMAIKVAAETGVEYIALSFVKDAREVETCTDRIRAMGSEAAIIAKIERPEAVEDIERIAEVSDGVMVARGDLGDTLPYETLPFVQKRIIDACVEAGKPAIVATQMMLSMVENPTPSRAEVTDVAVAVTQGASAVMLSEETAKGKHPRETVLAMRRIVVEAQKHHRKSAALL